MLQWKGVPNGLARLWVGKPISVLIQPSHVELPRLTSLCTMVHVDAAPPESGDSFLCAAVSCP